MRAFLCFAILALVAVNASEEPKEKKTAEKPKRSLDFGSHLLYNGLGIGSIGNTIGLGYSSGVASGGLVSDTHEVRHLSQHVPVAVPQPIPVTVNRHVPVPQPYPVEVPRPYSVPVQVNVPVDVPRAVPVSVPHPVPVRVNVPTPVEVPRPVPYEVTRTVPVDVPRTISVKVPHQVPVSVPQPYPVEVAQPVAVRVPQPVYVKERRLVNTYSHGVGPSVIGAYGAGSYGVGYPTAYNSYNVW